MGTINVIFVALRKDSGSVKEVMTISSQSVGDEEEGPLKKLKIQDQPILGFFEANK